MVFYLILNVIFMYKNENKLPATKKKKREIFLLLQDAN